MSECKNKEEVEEWKEWDLKTKILCVLFLCIPVMCVIGIICAGLFIPHPTNMTVALLCVMGILIFVVTIICEGSE